MLEQLCAELFYATLQFLNFESLFSLRNSAGWLHRRLSPDTQQLAPDTRQLARRFWTMFEENYHIFPIFLRVGLAPAKFLHGIYGLPLIVEDAGHTGHLGPYLILMHGACRSGDLAKMRWVVDAFQAHYNIPGPLSFDNSHREPLWIACEHGHLNVAQWLADNYAGGITCAAAREWERYYGDWWLPELLALVCAQGHLAIAQWLVRRFEMTAEEIRLPPSISS